MPFSQEWRRRPYICKKQHERRADKKKTDEVEYESLYVEMKVSGKKIILGVIYRPPKLSEESESKLYDEIKNIINNKNAVICGDFNKPSVNWLVLSGDSEGRRLINFAEEAFFHKWFRRPLEATTYWI